MKIHHHRIHVTKLKLVLGYCLQFQTYNVHLHYLPSQIRYFPQKTQQNTKQNNKNITFTHTHSHTPTHTHRTPTTTHTHRCKMQSQHPKLKTTQQRQQRQQHLL